MDIEEDIKILENLKKYLNLLIYEGTHKIIYNDLGWDEKTIDCINAIDHILEEREEDKKKIAELKEYIFIAPNLDEMTAAKYISIRRDAYIRGRADEQQKAEEIINNNYVSKQKVKDLKESIVLEPTIVGGRRNAKTLEYGIKLGKIKACEELLEEK